MTAEIQSIITRLIDLGYSESEARYLYRFYNENNKLQDLKNYIEEKENLRGAL